MTTRQFRLTKLRRHGVFIWFLLTFKGVDETVPVFIKLNHKIVLVYNDFTTNYFTPDYNDSGYLYGFL